MPIRIQKNIPLAKYTTFKIGGPAKYFCVAKNADEIKEALKFAEKNKLEIFVLGGGSNLLVSDGGFDGLVIKVQSSRLKIENNSSEPKIICGSGVSLAKLVLESVKANLTGMEWAAGIPGTVGGAVCNNSGAHRKSMEDVVEEAEVLENCVSPLKKGAGGISGKSNKENVNLTVKKFANEQCQFSYRSSIFKKEKGYIVLNVVLKLKKGDKKESRKIISEHLKSRTDKQPSGCHSAGSVFKNPQVDDEYLKKIFTEYPKLKTIVKNNTIPAGWFVETLKLKGKKIGGAMISEKHGNFIVNAGKAKAEDVVILISLIKQKVRNNFGIQLNEEIEYVGF